MSTYETLLKQPIEVSLAEIGAGAIHDAFGPCSFQDLVRAGQRWLEANADRLKEQLCPHVVDIQSRPTPVEVIAAIADLVAALDHTPAVAAVSVLIYRFGLNALCREGEGN